MVIGKITTDKCGHSAIAELLVKNAIASNGFSETRDKLQPAGIR